MGNLCKTVRDEYKLYCKILDGLKFTGKKSISLVDAHGSHRKWKHGQEKVTCVLGNLGLIKIRQAKSQLMDYSFQLFVDKF